MGFRGLWGSLSLVRDFPVAGEGGDARALLLVVLGSRMWLQMVREDRIT